MSKVDLARMEVRSLVVFASLSTLSGNIRNTVTSITRRRLYGLKLELFLEKVQRDIGKDLGDLNVSIE